MEKKVKFIEVKTNPKKITEINKLTSKRLDTEFNIQTVPPEAIPTMVYTYLQQLCAYVAKNYKNNIEINFLQLFDFGISTEEDEDGKTVYIPYVTPGQDCKLKSKSDDETESDEEE